jgi:hypothetical protein
MENKQTAMQQFIEWMIEESQVIPVQAEECYDKAKELLEIEKENMLDFGLFVKREGWALKTGKNIDDLYNDFFNQK